jgi:alpha-1,2-mannosyltransferase
MPALLLLVDRAVDRSVTEPAPRRRLWLWGLLLGSTAILGSRVVWAFDDVWTNPLVWFVSNAYVWVSLALLIGLPVAATGVPVAITPETVRPAAPSAAEPVPNGSAPDFDVAVASLLRDERVAVGDGGVRPPG